MYKGSYKCVCNCVLFIAVIELNDSKSDDLDYEKIPLCDFFIDHGDKKKKKPMESTASVTQAHSQTIPRKYSRTSDERSPNRQKSACMDCQAVFYADTSMCTYCDTELKRITPDQAKNCLNCGEMIRKRCRKCPFCHYNYGIFTFGRWLCDHCSRCNTARTPACLGCGIEKPGSASSKKVNITCLYVYTLINFIEHGIYQSLILNKAYFEMPLLSS